MTVLHRLINKLVIVSILSSFVLLSGCWDMRYLDRLGVVVAIGIDDDPEEKHKLLVTTQVVLTQNIASGNKKGGSGGSSVTIFSETGDTIFEALRKMSALTSRRLFFSHTQMLIISESAARQNIFQLLDLIERNPDIRTDISIAIVRNVTAKKALQTITQLETIPVKELMDIIQVNHSAYGTNFERTVQDILRTKGRGQKEAALPSFYLQGNKKDNNKQSNVEPVPAESYFRMGTMAVLRSGKLIGYLSPKESRGLAWLRGKVKSSIVQVACPGSDEHLAIEVHNADTKIKVVGSQFDIPEIQVKIRMNGSLRDIMCPNLDVLDEETLHEIMGLARAVVLEEVEGVVEKLQNDLQSDVLHWGQEVYNQKPRLWDRIEDDWGSIFPKVSYKVNCEVEIFGAGSRDESIAK